MKVSRADLAEGAGRRRRLAVGVVPPAGERAVGAQAAGVKAARADLAEGPNPWRRLAAVVVSPASDRAVGDTERFGRFRRAQSRVKAQPNELAKTFVLLF